jgi:two-component system, OmpR family, sensor histidine kinase SenX3
MLRSRSLLFVTLILALLLLILAQLQYRWAQQMTASEAQSALYHMQNAASLFAHEFDLRVAEAYVTIQSQSLNQHATSQPAGAVPDLPAIVHSLLFVDRSGRTARHYQRRPDGLWEQAAPGAAVAGEMVSADEPCVSRVVPEKFVLTVPVPDDTQHNESTLPGFNRCIYAQLSSAYVMDTLLPALIEQYFGKDEKGELSFAVVDRAQHVVWSARQGQNSVKARVKQNFFTLRGEVVLRTAAGQRRNQPGQSRSPVYVQAETDMTPQSESVDEDSGGGAWTLEIWKDDNTQLTSSLTSWRNRNLLIGVVVEVLLLLSAALLVLSVRRLDAVAQQRMQFVAGVSHELRTPLATIAMLSSNQADGLKLTPEQVRHYGSLIYEQVERLSDMVEGTLQFAGIHSGLRSRKCTEVDVHAVVQAALDAKDGEMLQTGAEVEFDVPADLPCALGDPALLQQAIENLLSNALKYSNGHCSIRVAAQYDDDAKMIAITVSDHGMGIDSNEIDRVFEPFFRGRRALATQIPGNGIGLSLVRAAVAAQRGTVTLSSDPNGGTAFTIRVPSAPRDQS